MSIKREVIINGINVSSCEELCSAAVHPSCYHLNGFCEDNPNCMFKQHARKTAECEELQKKQDILIQGYIKRLKEWYNYKQALREVEELAKGFCKDCDDCKDCDWEKDGCYYSLIPELFTITAKVKDKNNEQARTN